MGCHIGMAEESRELISQADLPSPVSSFVDLAGELAG